MRPSCSAAIGLELEQPDQPPGRSRGHAALEVGMRRLHHLVGEEIEGGALQGALVQDDQALPLHRPDVIARAAGDHHAAARQLANRPFAQRREDQLREVDVAGLLNVSVADQVSAREDRHVHRRRSARRRRHARPSHRPQSPQIDEPPGRPARGQPEPAARVNVAQQPARWQSKRAADRTVARGPPARACRTDRERTGSAGRLGAEAAAVRTADETGCPRDHSPKTLPRSARAACAPLPAGPGWLAPL